MSGRAVPPDMRLVVALVFGAAAAWGASDTARARGHERIPPDHWSYRAVERFEALGYCTLPEIRPFARAELARIVGEIAERVDDTALSPRDAYQLDRLEREFTRGDARTDPRARYDRALTAGDSALALEADFDARAFAERAPFGEDVEYFVAADPTVKVHVGSRVTYDVRYRLVFGPEHGDRADDRKPSRRERSFNGLTSLFDRSYLAASWPRVDLVAGRDYVDWGPGGADRGLITPGARHSIDHVGARARLGAFRLDAFHGQLFGAPERWMAGHRLEATFGRTVVGVSETVVYHGRGFEMLYMLPLGWFYANQFNERDNSDNVLWSADAKTNAIAGLTLHAGLLIDDFQFEREAGFPDKLAFEAGFRWVPARPPGLSVGGSYRRVDIYTYSHVDSLSVYVSGAGDVAGGDVLLGGVPDADDWRVEAEVFPRPRLALTAGWFGARVGEGSDLRGFEPGDDKNPPFPSGIVDETVGFDLAARYEFDGDSWVAVTYAHATATNRGHVAGRDRATDAFRLEIRWDIP